MSDGVAIPLDTDGAAAARALVERLGSHLATAAGLGPDPEDDRELAVWWALVCLADPRREDAAEALAALRALAERGALTPGEWASQGPEKLAAWLEAAGLPGATRAGTVLWRTGRSLVADYDGSLAGLARGCEDLEELGGRLARLAPGFGRSSVVRYLQPLRDGWSAAAELPLDRAAHAAAVHLGWLSEGDDEEAGPGTLRARLSGAAGAPAFHDVEAALARLGRRACARGRVQSCPLGDACPAR
ncbi:MAG: hypothetical protein ACQGVK_24620 [Myxococcota bacterium]